MKRLFAAAAALLLTLCASAQGFIVKGGLNFSHFDPDNISNYNAWTAGIGWQTYSRGGFSIQPELIYRVNGATFKDAAELAMNYLELPVNVQWGIDLLVAKPFIFVAPFVGYNLSNAITPDNFIDLNSMNNAVDDFDYGIGAGVGLNVWKLQLSAKCNWMFGHVANWGAFVESLRDLDINMATCELSVGFKF